MILSFVICKMLASISDILCIVATAIVVLYIIYNFTNKKARQIRKKIKQEKEFIYEKYKREEVDNKITFKDYVLPSGNKVEYIDFKTNTVYLLRPYVENVEKKYERQIQKYLDELKEVHGGNWSCVIDTY